MPSQGMRIQPDWDKAILEKDRSFWFHLYGPDRTYHQKVEISEGTLTPDTSDVDCCVSTSKTIRLRDNARCLQSTFQCPDFRFSSVHKQPRQPTLHLNSFDVNASGELALSASSDGNVVLWETKTSEIRRKFVGHSSEVYCCRFFPSGLVVVTAGGDMQLRVWCALTGACPAILRAGSGGVDVTSANPPTNSSTATVCEPGGHRAGVIDVDFVDRGRNIVAVDRGGWLRLWDVSTQIAISAMSVTPRSPGSTLQTNCSMEEAPACCVVKRRVSSDEATAEPTVESSENYYGLESTSTRATAVGVTDKLVAVGCGSHGRLLLFDISSAHSRKRGPILQLSLPCASGAVTACAVSMETGTSAGGVFNEFGLVAGGSSGEITCWDLRNYCTPLFTYEAYKYGVCALQMVHFPAHSVDIAGGENLSVPAFTGIFSAFRDGRTVLRRMVEGGLSIDGDGYSRCLELTGPDAEAICGLRTHNIGNASVWTGTYSAQFFGYRRIAVESLFNL
ncbi:proteasomal ATPase associated factor 1 [Echinococcus multilocularis]|uniref:Proteasomal ATPase associated factor 1 n=1 Tax=Echinococcus multilocularis TaxID=6211 RepID=A0A068YMI7_ECHMU|nr:proteasomal ATPase associated factor 1 [Echinococcus multilocularis]